MFLPGLLLSPAVWEALPFSAPGNLSLCCFGCGCVAVFGTEPDKCECKGMDLWMIRCDTGEGEKR